MDPITHGLIGASASQSFAAKKQVRTGAFVGFVSALLPDLDVLIDSPADPLLNLEFHRQFTHSLVFMPVGAFIAAGILWWFVRKKLTFKQTYLFSLLGYASGGLADLITSYGVQLLWPFTHTRLSLDLVSVVDPLFSVGIAIAVGFALYHKNGIMARSAFAWIALYLLFAASQRDQVISTGKQLAEQRNHSIEKLIVKPTIANQLLWSVRYTTGDSIYTAGVRLHPFTDPDIYEGESAALFNWRRQFAAYKSSTMYEDIRRFEQFSDSVLIRHPEHSKVIGDGRYAMLPTSVKPLWGIKIDTTAPNRHVQFKPYRDAGKEVRQQFWKMLKGKE
jgi:inner membrane protein